MNILRLKELLKEKGVTGKQLAEIVGVSQPAISEFATNKSHPRPELLLKIAAALDVDLKDLFISTKPQKSSKDIIQAIKNSIEDLEALYGTIDKTS